MDVLSNEIKSSRQQAASRSALPFAETSPQNLDGYRPYLLVNYSYAEQGATVTQDRITSRLGSINAGLTRELGTGPSYGFGLSYVTLNSDMDSDGIFASGAISQDFGFTELGFGLGAGRLNHKSDRVVTGSPNAEADYSSTLYHARARAERDFEQVNGATFTPFAQLTYGQQDFDGYSETVSLANTTLGDHEVTFSEVKLGAS